MKCPICGYNEDSVPHIQPTDNKRGIQRRFAVEHANATNMENGSAVTFEVSEGYSYILMCDGTGSGREASLTSKMCTAFLEWMLSGTNDKRMTFKMLNGFMNVRECGATVDVAEIDLTTGKASFFKSGASPSFIIRNGNVYNLNSNTVPMGVKCEPDVERICLELVPSDIIVMVSDGVMQSLEVGVWLANQITDEWDDDLSAMVKKLLNNAVLENPCKDNMTVVIARVSEAEQ